jgi:hypothetical protein
MIFYDGGKRQKGTLVLNFSTFSSRQGRGTPPSSFIKTKQKNKKCTRDTKKARERATHLKNKKKQKKLVCLMNKNLSSSSKNSLSLLCAAQVEKNGPLLRGAKRGEDEQHDEQQQKQKQRGDQRTLRITLKPRPETRRREIRVRGFE